MNRMSGGQASRCRSTAPIAPRGPVKLRRRNPLRSIPHTSLPACPHLIVLRGIWISPEGSHRSRSAQIMGRDGSRWAIVGLPSQGGETGSNPVGTTRVVFPGRRDADLVVQFGRMKISPLEDVLQISGPVTGHNAGELFRAIDEHDAKHSCLPCPHPTIARWRRVEAGTGTGQPHRHDGCNA